MTRIEQLTALRDAVRDGRENDAYDICKPLPIPATDLFQAAFRKDMNTALALFAALLPGWAIYQMSVWPDQPAKVEIWGTHEARDGKRWHNFSDGRFDATAPDPARALLLAMLEALIKKSQSDELAMPKEEG